MYAEEEMKKRREEKKERERVRAKGDKRERLIFLLL
jgi:hypothetical protein